MDNNRTEILAEIESRMQALREELGELENKVSELRKSVEAAEMSAVADETAPVDWSEIEVTVGETTQESFVVEDMPEDMPEDEPVQESAEEPAEEKFPETVLSPDDPADAEEELEVAVMESGEPEFAVPEPAATDSAATEPSASEPVAEAPAVHEVAASGPAVRQPVAAMPQKRYAWQTDLPGVPVKNIRSAISLYDRALFINTLFKEDYALYDKTVGDLNAASSLEEAEKYLMTYFPDWNFGSEVVYGFMMAVRKKLG